MANEDEILDPSQRLIDKNDVRSSLQPPLMEHVSQVTRISVTVFSRTFQRSDDSDYGFVTIAWTAWDSPTDYVIQV